jgi:hypothetical protein
VPQERLLVFVEAYDAESNYLVSEAKLSSPGAE